MVSHEEGPNYFQLYILFNFRTMLHLKTVPKQFCQNENLSSPRHLCCNEKTENDSNMYCHGNRPCHGFGNHLDE